MFEVLAELDLRLLRNFLVVVEAGGISAAQTTLNATQPYISSQVAKLESRVGFRLCERGPCGFSMTLKGDQFVDSARRFVAAAEVFHLNAQHISSKVSGNLDIGLIGQIDPVVTNKIASSIAALRAQHEEIRLQLTELSSSLLVEKIVDHRIDVAIGYFCQRLQGIEYHPLFQETQMAYCAQAHPLFERAGALTKKDFTHCEWVWPCHPLPEIPTPSARKNLTVLTDSMELAAIFILSGQHLGFLPQHYAAQYERLGQLRALNPVSMRYEVDFHMVARDTSPQRDVVSAFLQALKRGFS